MKVIARTPRLLLRELSEEDLGSLGGTLMDAEAMAALGGAMDREQALTWLRRQIGRYRTGEPACWGVEERVARRLGMRYVREMEFRGAPHGLWLVSREDLSGRGCFSRETVL